MNPRHFRRFVIEPVLQDLGLCTPAAVALMLGTALHESAGLAALTEIEPGPLKLGPGIGVYQIEHPTHEDLFASFLHRPKYQALGDKVEAYLGRAPSPDEQLATNLAYATAVARCLYYRATEPLPAFEHRTVTDLGELGGYWKRHYNTELGAGTPDQWVASFARYSGLQALEG